MLCPNCDKPVSLTIADLTVDLVGRMVTRDGKYVPLSAKPFDLLVFLLRNRGKVQSRETIEREVWPYLGRTSNVVDVTLSALRRAIDPGRSSPLIHTVKGVGYVMAERWGA